MTTNSSTTDVVDILTQDHREVAQLVTQILSSTDAGQRRDMADTIVAELVRHSVAEEMHVYPVMRKHLPDGEEAVQHDIEEHKELEATLKQIEKAEPEDAEFDQLIRTLDITLRDHVQDEEADQFPQLRAKVPAETLADLGAKVERAKKLAPTRPHPSAPNNELFHKAVGPGVGFVDRLRDKLTGRG